MRRRIWGQMHSEQMLPVKCSPKNAPWNKMLPVKMLSIKMLPLKNAPRKKMLSSPTLVNGFETNSTYLNLT